MKKIFLFIFMVINICVANDEYYVIELKDNNLLERINGECCVTRLEGDKITVNATKTELEKIKSYIKNIERVPRNTRGHKMAHTIKEWSENWPSYPDYPLYLELMDSIANEHPSFTRLDTFGYSVDGRSLLSLKISNFHRLDKMKPQVHIYSGIHGDETPTIVTALKLIEYLCENYQKDSLITSIIDSTEIKVFPSLNPDGTYHTGDETVTGAVRRTRENIDMNRDFPSRFIDDNPDTTGRAVETKALMKSIACEKGHVSIAYHTGAVLVNYPWDGLDSGRLTSGIEHHCPDSAWYIKTALDYAVRNDMIYYSDEFENGITNGAYWYTAYGTLQDWLYHYHKNFNFTIEMNNVKNPPATDLEIIWENNRESIINFLDNSRKCLQGIVSSRNHQPLSALVQVEEIPETIIETNEESGFYVRYLPEGNFKAIYESEGFNKKEVDFAFNWDPFYMNVYLDEGTRINETRKHNERIIVYPNPFNEEIVIKCHAVMEKLELYNLLGRKVFSVNTTGKSAIRLKIPKHLSQGQYFLKIRGENLEKTLKMTKIK